MNLPFLPTSEDNLADIGSSVDDWQYPLDLNRLILPRPASTFLLEVDVSRYGIHKGDIAVVDRSIAPSKNQVVVAVMDSELCLARFPVEEIWGVVTYIIRSMR